MKVQVLHRDSTNVYRLFDYLHFQYCKRDKSCREYYIKKSNALLSLVQCVVDNELTDKQREVFNLVLIEGHSSADVANILGVNPSTISRHLHAIQEHMNRAYEHFKSVEHHLIGED